MAAAAGLSVGCLDRPITPARPTTSNVVVAQIRQSAVDKIDLLFMIDNSVSMADKQAILSAAVPVLLSRLVTPICVNSTTGDPIPGSVSPCTAAGTEAEFTAINDIHIGIVSSSLGGHGGDVCAAASVGQENVLDMAHLVGLIRGAGQVAAGAATIDPATTYAGKGFLAWDPLQTKNTPPGDRDRATLQMKFQNMVSAVGEHGCGYEAQLEAWYRFLIDPDPPSAASLSGSVTVTTGPDTAILAQRAAFLRQDSLVAIIMLSDENDCSVVDYGSGWIVGLNQPGQHLPKGTTACATNPNDPCCRSCALDERPPNGPPAGCTALTADPQCASTLDATTDSLNLRCYRQKQRFGFDLMYPVSRYIGGLRGDAVTNRDGSPGVNGLYASTTGAPRDPSLVFLAGIVGVPWQDIATDDTLNDPNRLTYRKAADLADRWPAILGDPTASPPIEPTDPFMLETFSERAGANPFVPSAVITPASSNAPTANPINGHEQKIPLQDDLQYACTFRLATPKVCAAGDNACDCSPAMNGTTTAVTTANSPLCQPPGGGAPGTTQYFAKAYPGLRELQVLKGYGANSIVASICPKILDQNNTDFGYNPAVGAIIDRLKDALRGKCLPRPLAYDALGKLPCKIVEAVKPKTGETCDTLCKAGGRDGFAEDFLRAPVLAQLASANVCDTGPDAECSAYCLCTVHQEAPGPDLTSCQTGGNPPPGVCYVDQAIVTANMGAGANLLANCPATDKRLLRFVSGDVPLPRQGAIGFFACTGSPIVANP